jgi:hypothetical protein
MHLKPVDYQPRVGTICMLEFLSISRKFRPLALKFRKMKAKCVICWTMDSLVKGYP